MPRGWSQLAPIKTESRIDTPRDGSKKSAGQIVVAGVAWAQHRGISKVEVRVDDGEWQVGDARRGAVDRHLAAVAVDLERDAPDHIACRYARPTTPARRRPARMRRRAPDGATGYHTINVKIS